MAKVINQILIGQKFDEANEKYLGMNGGNENQTSFSERVE